MNHNEQRHFLRMVRRKLACPHATKKNIMENFESHLLDYLEQNPTAAQQEVYDLFGAPKTVAGRYLDEINPAVLKKHEMLKRILIFAIVLILLLTAYAVITHERPGKIIDTPAWEVIDTSPQN